MAVADKDISDVVDQLSRPLQVRADQLSLDVHDGRVIHCRSTGARPIHGRLAYVKLLTTGGVLVKAGGHLFVVRPDAPVTVETEQ